MKRVLLIAYHFPPEGGPGTQRSAKFAKYLGEFGWQPIVLTRSNPSARDVWHAEDRTLLGDLPRSVKIVRVAPAGVNNWASGLPAIDVGREWIEAAFDAARRIIEEVTIDAVFVTMSPFDLSFLGLRIHDQLAVPAVFDLRDPWALDGWRLRGTKRRWRRDWNAMQFTLPKAAGVIANTEEARLEILRCIPELRGDRVIAIPNGYDEADFANCAAKPIHQTANTFRICHLGTLHCSELYRYEGPLGWLKRLKHYRPEPIEPGGRSAYYLLRALKLLRDECDPRVEMTRVVLAGPIDESTRRCINESGVADLVETVGYVSHDQAVGLLLEADALFVPLHGLPPGRRSRIVPGKLYECLRSGRPILGCLPAGDARELAERGGGMCCNPCDADQIAGMIRTFWSQWERGELQTTETPQWLRRYERHELTRELAEFFNRMTNGQGTQITKTQVAQLPVLGR